MDLEAAENRIHAPGRVARCLVWCSLLFFQGGEVVLRDTLADLVSVVFVAPPSAKM